MAQSSGQEFRQGVIVSVLRRVLVPQWDDGDPSGPTVRRPALHYLLRARTQLPALA